MKRCECHVHLEVGMQLRANDSFKKHAGRDDLLDIRILAISEVKIDMWGVLDATVTYEFVTKSGTSRAFTMVARSIADMYEVPDATPVTEGTYR